MSEISARVEWIKFYNQENAYAVLSCADDTEKFSVVGNIPNPVKGQEYSFNGDWIVDPKYGRQFKALQSKRIEPTSIEGIKQLLQSGIVKGIGKATAARIVDVFGIDTLRIIEEEPERLMKIKGIKDKTYKKITQGWAESQGLIKLQRFLQDNGITENISGKIYKEYGVDSISAIRENPYVLTSLWGISFRTADTIAYNLGLLPTDPNRLRAYIIHYLRRNSSSGHCYEHASVLIDKCAAALKVNKPPVQARLIKMKNESDSIIEDDGLIYLKKFYHAECGIASRLFSINQYKGSVATADIEELEKTFGIKYDEIQTEAIRSAVRSKVAIITGGPGTGKTTIIRAIVKAFQDNGKNVVLASPTGRAAKRMADVVGEEAKTIHRLLEYNPLSEGFMRNEDNTIEGDVLVLDECSMIDVVLMNDLLKAVPDDMNVVMVGDIDQLPSVGPGNVLADIINSGCYYVARLTKVFRQAEESDIISNAHRINRGLPIELRNRDVRFIGTNNIKQAILNVVLNIDEGCTAADVQVISPVKKTDTGTIELNNALQDALNQNPVVFSRKYTKYRIGDRVMQIKNNYSKEVFNGSLGEIKSCVDEVLTVDFDGHEVQYDKTEIDEIMLAYAITVHKSQGSEFPVVIIPLSMQHKVMLQRNLIYTAFTRPAKMLYLIGDKRALDYAIENDVAMERRTQLIKRIRKWYDQ